MERRFRAPVAAVKVTCRVCFEHVDLLRERVEDTPVHCYYRCPSCEGSFPIRRSDLGPGWGSGRG
ncbi:hypothetical protein BH20ACT2_BH20ACT2_07200 [soil metagenome]